MHLNRIQHIQNALARAVIAAPRSSNPDHILKSLHWLKVQERIKYKVTSTTYKLLQPSSPHYLRDLITVQPSRSTRSSALVILLQPSIDSSLRFFQYATPHLRNKLPSIFRVPYQFDPSSSPTSFPSSYSDPALLVDLSRRILHFRLKTFLFSTSNVTAITKVRSARFALVLHVQHVFANSFNFLVTWGLLVTVFHSTCIFCVYTQYGTVLANTAVLPMWLRIVCLPVRGAPCTASAITTLYYAMLHVCMLFHCIVQRILKKIEVWASSSYPRISLCQISFFLQPP